YHFHDEQNVQNGAYSLVRGSFNSPTLWSPTIASLGPSLAALSAPSGVTALDPTDDQEPRTQSYSFTVAERLPWKSVLEVAYVGSKSDYLTNYNSLQVTWNKQAGHFTFLTNYTFAKALGIRSENGDGNQGADPTNLRSNYGTLPNNRTHIFNFAYVYEFPTVHNATGS